MKCDFCGDDWDDCQCGALHKSSSRPTSSADMTGEERMAFAWARSTPHSSVAARYANILAKYIERQNTELSEESVC